MKAGQIMHLGSHRLACGSATDEALVKRLTGDKQPRVAIYIKALLGVPAFRTGGPVVNLLADFGHMR